MSALQSAISCLYGGIKAGWNHLSNTLYTLKSKDASCLMSEVKRHLADKGFQQIGNSETLLPSPVITLFSAIIYLVEMNLHR